MCAISFTVLWLAAYPLWDPKDRARTRGWKIRSRQSKVQSSSSIDFELQSGGNRLNFEPVCSKTSTPRRNRDLLSQVSASRKYLIRDAGSERPRTGLTPRCPKIISENSYTQTFFHSENSVNLPGPYDPKQCLGGGKSSILRDSLR